MMHIGGALIFEPLPTGGPPSLEQLRALLDERLGTLPAFAADCPSRAFTACTAQPGSRIQPSIFARTCVMRR